MSRRVLFRKIIGLSVLRGLQAGAVLGFAAGFCLMLSIGFWAVLFGLMYGCALGSAMGLVNGLLLACLICRFFFPYTASGALRQVTQTGSVALSLLVTILLTVAVAIAAGVGISSVVVFLAIAVPLVGAAAWWASRQVGYWYEAVSTSAVSASSLVPTRLDEQAK